MVVAHRLFCVKDQLPLRLSLVLDEGQQSLFFASCLLTTNFFRNRLSLFFFLDLGEIFFSENLGEIFFLWTSLGFFGEGLVCLLAITLLCFFCKQPLVVPLVQPNHQTPF